MRRSILFSFVVTAFVAVGCTEPNPLYCGDGECSDPAFPYCDKDGLIGGTRDTCLALTCPANGDFVTCKGERAVTCNDARDSYVISECQNGCNEASQGCNLCTPEGSFCSAGGVQHCDANGMPSNVDACAGGCVDSPEPHCAYIVPHYLPNACDEIAIDDVTYTANATLGTDLDTLCTGGIVQQSAAPDICVVRGRTIRIAQGVTLKVAGARALAFVADDEVSIDGVLDVSADNTVDGPGGGSVTSGGAINNGSGGGGAGFKTAGGHGGDGSTDGGAANGGAASTNPALLAVLIGGARNVGGGGGAAVIVACRGNVDIGGVVDAGGGGGVGGSKPGVIARGGAGGGAGGNVVLQGLQINVSGKLYANGGGGGAGYTGTVTGNAGKDATPSLLAAAGGLPQGVEGAGGAGGAKGALPGDGRAPGATGTAGGGGGSVGFFQTYTPSSVTPSLTPSESSPDFEPNLQIETK